MGLFSRLVKVVRASWHFSGRAGNDAYRGPDHRMGHQDQRSSRSRRAGGAAAADARFARYYANLEIPFGSDLPTVRKAWKRLLRRYHPDLHSNDPEKQRIANDIVKGLNEAYEALEKHLSS